MTRWLAGIPVAVLLLAAPHQGVVWARDDVANASSMARIKTRYGKPSVIMGLSLGLDKAIGWLQGPQ